MHLNEIEVKGLFNHYDHTVRFPSPDNGDPRPSLVILHGPNGAGKTTLLRMLDGLIRLDFNQFRRVPFKYCKLSFSTGDCIQVQPALGEYKFRPLNVTFRNLHMLLSGEKSGPYSEQDQAETEEFRQTFFSATESLTFDFIDTERIVQRLDLDERQLLEESNLSPPEVLQYLNRRRRATNPKSREFRYKGDLASRVRQFISEAQLNSSSFFARDDPDLFSRILMHITEAAEITYSPQELLDRLSSIRQQNERFQQLGLETESWDHHRIQVLLYSAKDKLGFSSAVSALGAYVDMLESRTAERALVADRLMTFEKLMLDFLSAKRVKLDRKLGLQIVTDEGQTLREDQLSSGEYHLLYLMVAALTTRRRGTIIAIDEPEISMHLSWQRKLVRTLIKCASGAEPQFIFATHSPDVAAEYADAMVPIGNLAEV